MNYISRHTQGRTLSAQARASSLDFLTRHARSSVPLQLLVSRFIEELGSLVHGCQPRCCLPLAAMCVLSSRQPQLCCSLCSWHGVLQEHACSSRAACFRDRQAPQEAGVSVNVFFYLKKVGRQCKEETTKSQSENEKQNALGQICRFTVCDT